MKLLSMTVTAILLLTVPSYAGYNCGRYMRGITGQSDRSLNLALNWARFQHTTAHPGAVVVQRRRGHSSNGGPGGHVSRIVRVTGNCRAIVRDNRGQYERDICKNLVAYVDPNGNRVSNR